MSCMDKKLIGKGVAYQLETIGEILKNCCCGIMCKLKKIRGTCICETQSSDNLENATEQIIITIDKEEVLITKICASFFKFVEGTSTETSIGIITVKDADNNIVFEDAFGDDLTNTGIEHYETTFMHPLLIKGPVTIELSFLLLGATNTSVAKQGTLSVVYSKESAM
ncbi:hypothetical protein [Defluviitalea phaphyphila]|uniref:hypothetical protein n=1 Tax=Defluviitalea phaphyphila TaxID=1473580 RepID=UPI0007318018|nr:hypothetical protein [Defluviitalea phaphyphila]